MFDKERFKKEFEEFLDSTEHGVLITGHDDDAKINVVLNVLNNKANNGTIMCSQLGRIAEIINRAFKNKPLPNKIKGRTFYNIGKMKVLFNKYIDSHNPIKIGADYDFVLYYPVETVLMEGRNKDLESLIKDISNTVSNKVIILTTNDQKKNLTPLRNVVDRHIHYESKNDNPELVENLKEFFGDFEYPLFK